MKSRTFSFIAAAALVMVTAVLWRLNSSPFPSPVSSPALANPGLSPDLKMTAAQATARAVAEIGLENYNAAKTMANPVALTAESMPFLGENLAGKKTWSIQFQDVHLPTRGRDDQLIDNPYVQELKVVLAPDSGHVMSIISPWPADEPPWQPCPPSAEAARWTRMAGIRYVGLPNEAPSFTLIQAMLGPGMMEWSTQARQIVVYYVVETRHGGLDPTEYPVWAVHIHGFPAMPMPRGPLPPPGTLDVLTNEIDARTGRWLGAANYPLELKPPDRGRNSAPMMRRGGPATQPNSGSVRGRMD